MDKYSRIQYHGLVESFSDLKYTLITQKPKIELFGFISNIGGTLGLFIGFSFISVLELFELLVEYTLIIFNYWLKYILNYSYLKQK